MLGSRFFWKLYVGYVALVVLAAAIVGSQVSVWAGQSREQSIELSLREKARLSRQLFTPQLKKLSSPDAKFQASVASIGDSISTRITVMTADGVVLADSAKDPREMDRHHDRAEILQAQASEDGFGKTTRSSRTLGKELMYVALLVKDDDKPLGFVRTAVGLEIIKDERARVRDSVLVGALVSVVLALALGFFVAHRVTAPLTSITRVARSIAGGDYGERVPAQSGDEVGDLANAFNEMTDQLQDRMQTITKDRNELKAVLASMVEGVIAVDREEDIVQMNQVAADLLGVNAAASVGQPVWKVTRVREIGEATRQALTNGEDFCTEATVILDGRETILEMIASPLRVENEEAGGVVVVLHDVSELRRLESVRSEFVANASHELKTPITAIRGLVETLVEDGSMPAETRQSFIRRIKNQSTRLSSLVTDLLTLSRLESTAAQEVSPIDWRSIVREVVRGYRSIAEAKQIRVECDVPDRPIHVLSDSETLRLITSNLLDNAIKYTPEGGEVRVRLGFERSDALLTVRDTGIGIAPEEQERIFERFYRVDKARSRELGGTGLGLSIVKHAVNSLGGTITVESARNDGSVFSVCLPASFAEVFERKP